MRRRTDRAGLFGWAVLELNETNPMNQINKTDQIDRASQLV